MANPRRGGNTVYYLPTQEQIAIEAAILRDAALAQKKAGPGPNVTNDPSRLRQYSFSRSRGYIVFRPHSP